MNQYDFKAYMQVKGGQPFIYPWSRMPTYMKDGVFSSLTTDGLKGYIERTKGVVIFNRIPYSYGSTDSVLTFNQDMLDSVSASNNIVNGTQCDIANWFRMSTYYLNPGFKIEPADGYAVWCTSGEVIGAVAYATGGNRTLAEFNDDIGDQIANNPNIRSNADYSTAGDYKRPGYWTYLLIYYSGGRYDWAPMPYNYRTADGTLCALTDAEMNASTGVDCLGLLRTSAGYEGYKYKSKRIDNIDKLDCYQNDDAAVYNIFDRNEIFTFKSGYPVSLENDLDGHCTQVSYDNRKLIKVGDFIKFEGHIVMVSAINDFDNNGRITLNEILIIESADCAYLKVQKGRPFSMYVSWRLPNTADNWFGVYRLRIY